MYVTEPMSKIHMLKHSHSNSHAEAFTQPTHPTNSPSMLAASAGVRRIPASRSAASSAPSAFPESSGPGRPSQHWHSQPTTKEESSVPGWPSLQPPSSEQQPPLHEQQPSWRPQTTGSQATLWPREALHEGERRSRGRRPHAASSS